MNTRQEVDNSETLEDILHQDNPAQARVSSSHEATTAGERFEEQKASFLTFDKASGSRWLNEEKLLAFISSECERARGEAIDEVYAMAAEVFDPMPFEGEAVSWYKRTRASFFSRLVSLTHTKL